MQVFLLLLLSINLAYAAEPGLKLEEENLDYSIRSYLNTIKINQASINSLNTPFSQIRLTASYTEPSLISFEDILAKSIENNLNFNIAKLNSKIAKWNFYEKFADALPDLNGSANFQHRQGTFYLNSQLQTPVDQGIGSASLRLNYTAFRGGKTLFLLLAEKFYRSATELKEQAAYNLALLEASQFYFALIQSKMSLATRHKVYKQAQANYDLASKYFEAGTGTKYDLLQAEARLAKIRQELANDEANLHLAQIDLAAHLHLPLSLGVDIETEHISELNLIEDDLSAEEFIKKAFDNNPNIQASLKISKAAYREALASAGEFLPQVDLFYDISGAGENLTDLSKINSIGFTAQYNIGQGLGLTPLAHFMQAKAKAQKAKLVYEQEMQNIEKALLLSYVNYKKSKSIMQAAYQELISNQEALRLARLRYENGLEILTNVLNKEKDLSESELNLVISTVQHNINQLKLVYNMGTISVEKLLTSIT